MSKVYLVLNTDQEVLEFISKEFKQIKTCPECNKENALLRKRGNYKETFTSYCPLCKKKYRPTKNTPFEYVRFGLVKAYAIFRYYKRTPIRDHNILYLSKRQNITYKSAYRFYSKIRSYYSKKININKKEEEYRKLLEFINKQNG